VNQPSIVKHTHQPFFQQHYRSTVQVARQHWSFMLGGRLDVPLMLSFDDLLTLPATSITSVVACIGNLPGGACMGQADWQGVALATLLREVRVDPAARHAHLYAADGYTTSITLDNLRASMLVYGMNDAPLSPEHGYPVRLIAPGLYGHKMPKWLQAIILADEPLAGLWERRGWSASGQVQTTSAFIRPNDGDHIDGPTLLQGVAYAGDRSITGVEVSIEDGPWMPVAFSQAAPHAWAHWSIEWTPPARGNYALRVQATDSAGFTQPEGAPPRPFPVGTAAQHTIIVHA
jgi:hypothetical protein